MARTTPALVIAAGAWLWAAAAAAQPAADCARAETAAEKAICSTPELAAADGAMARAYAALRTALPAEQHAALLADQQQWITQRDFQCRDSSGEKLTGCLLAETEIRRRFVAGEGPNRANGAPRLLPAFFREAREGSYEISIEYPQIPAASDPAAIAFNRAAHAAVFGKNLVAQYRAMKPPLGGGVEHFSEGGYRITHLDPRLASVVFDISSFTGGAHPNSARTTVLFDLGRGRALRLTDILADPTRVVPAIAAKCKAQLVEKATAEGWELFDNPDVAAVVRNITAWAADQEGIDILFDQYTVAAYVTGPHECRIPYTALSQWLKPGGMLPP